MRQSASYIRCVIGQQVLPCHSGEHSWADSSAEVGRATTFPGEGVGTATRHPPVVVAHGRLLPEMAASYQGEILKVRGGVSFDIQRNH